MAELGQGRPERRRLGPILVRAALLGFLGLIVLPIVVLYGGLGIAHLTDPACGTPGDSGGCEMGVAVLALFSAPVGFLGGVVLGCWLGWRRSRRL